MEGLVLVQSVSSIVDTLERRRDGERERERGREREREVKLN